MYNIQFCKIILKNNDVCFDSAAVLLICNVTAKVIVKFMCSVWSVHVQDTFCVHFVSKKDVESWRLSFRLYDRNSTKQEQTKKLDKCFTQKCQKIRQGCEKSERDTTIRAGLKNPRRMRKTRAEYLELACWFEGKSRSANDSDPVLNSSLAVRYWNSCVFSVRFACIQVGRTDQTHIFLFQFAVWISICWFMGEYKNEIIFVSQK